MVESIWSFGVYAGGSGVSLPPGVLIIGLQADVAQAVAWCAIPFPQYHLDGDEPKVLAEPGDSKKVPGHGEARVLVNFWFFLFVYYGFYNLTALIWITKVFNLYSLNWWV